MSSAAGQPPPTILALKQNFVSAQTRLLGQDMRPSRAWRAANGSSKSTIRRRSSSSAPSSAHALSDGVVDDAMTRLNRLLRQHSRRVHPAQATRHVAEQVDRLYTMAAADLGDGSEAEEDDDYGPVPRQSVRLQDPDVVAALPPTWPAAAAAAGEDVDADTASAYERLVARLRELSAAREAALARVNRLNALRALLEPFGDVSAVQENLVTRAGDVESELGRMRILLARVGDRVARLPDPLERGADEHGEHGRELAMEEAVMDNIVEVDEQCKIAALLDGL